jgi:hypothetical protein
MPDIALYGGGLLPADIEKLDDVPDIESAKLRRFLDYWLSRVEGGLPPYRTDIDPIDIPQLLSNIWIQERLPGSDDFRCRLAGESINEWHRGNIVGQLYREVIGEAAWAVVFEQYSLVVEVPGIGYSTGPVYMHTIHRPGVGERIFMPLRDKQGNNIFVIGITEFRSIAETSADAPPVTPRKTFVPLKALLDGRQA